MSLLKIAIVGSRDWPEQHRIDRFVNNMDDGTLLISGGARGADRFAEIAVKARSDRFPEPLILKPDYNKYHPKLAPKIRNSDIVEQCDHLFAFSVHNPPRGGTKDVTDKAKKAGKLRGIFYA